MGTSYQNLMVVGDVADVVGVLTDLGADAWVLPAGPGRVAVLPCEDACGYADADGLAGSVRATLRTGAMSNVVFDSDVVFVTIYRNGDRVHVYVSERAVVGCAGVLHGPADGTEIFTVQARIRSRMEAQPQSDVVIRPAPHAADRDPGSAEALHHQAAVG